jgi:hypothetical protein
MCVPHGDSGWPHTKSVGVWWRNDDWILTSHFLKLNVTSYISFVTGMPDVRTPTFTATTFYCKIEPLELKFWNERMQRWPVGACFPGSS